jgi:hypothetical protein
MGNLPIVTGYILRVFLGAILALIIGYLNVTGTPAAGLAASPLLLSLVAGFATDAVLSLLDRIALAITHDRNKREKAAGCGGAVSSARWGEVKLAEVGFSIAEAMVWRLIY